MLIEYGNTVVVPSWELSEEIPTGYSRIYYVRTGAVTYESSDERRPLKPDHLYILPSTIPYHVWRNREKDFAGALTLGDNLNQRKAIRGLYFFVKFSAIMCCMCCISVV